MLPQLTEEAARRQNATRAKPGEAADKRAPEIIQGRGEAVKHLADYFNTNPHYIHDTLNLLEAKRPDLAHEVHEGEMSFAEAKRQILIKKQEDALEQNPPTIPPGVPYDVIVADPPWPYKNDRLPYPTMTVDQIIKHQIRVEGTEMKLPIQEIAAENAILWLWVPNAHLREAFDVIHEWGFIYTGAMLTWVKIGNDGTIGSGGGTGSWLQGQTEHCLLARRGKPEYIMSSGEATVLAALDDDESMVLMAPREGTPGKGRHSRKPGKFYWQVDYLCPGKKIELFARPRENERDRAGWALHMVETPEPDA
jgi:N6-adenosine-specific RNA methylase IME4